MSNDERREIVITVAKSMLNSATPYMWGGNDPLGIDCSGDVVYCYQSAGILKQGTDYTADSLYKYLKERLSLSGLTYIRKASPDPGDCVFWFDKEHTAKHVEIALNSKFVIGASGSGRPRFDVESWIGVPAIAMFYDELPENSMREAFVRLMKGILFKDQAEIDNAFVSIKPITYRGHQFDFLDPFVI